MPAEAPPPAGASRNTPLVRRVRAAVGAKGRTVAGWRYAALALVGLSWRREAAPDRSPWRRAAASGWEAPADAVNPLHFSRAYQLPPFGRGNGLEALFWTPLARVPADRVDESLAALADQEIPAWAAAVHGAGADGLHDLWSASAGADAAQDVLMRVLRR